MLSKKTSKEDLNSAMRFINQQTKEESSINTPVKETPPKGFKPNRLYIETKSKRLQLLVQPSLHEKLKSCAVADGKSVNELVHSILEEAVQANS